MRSRGLRVVISMAALVLMFPLAGSAQTRQSPSSEPRTSYPLASGWRFLGDGVQFAEKPSFPDSGWARVSLPHTWNARDPFDDVPGYRRGIGWYRRHLALADSLRRKRLFLYFEGVNQVATVYVNGAFAGRHRGGYTAFALDITTLVRFDSAGSDNVIAVEANNGHDPFIPPLSIGYALYGGIYRDVRLIATDSIHIAVAGDGSPGVVISTPSVSLARGQLKAVASISNESSSAREIRIVNTVFDARGKIVSSRSSAVSAPPGPSKWTSELPEVAHPHLWSPDDPYLYKVRTEIYEGAVLRDVVTSPLGFRWFSFDAQTGFSLNGRKLPLRGTNRHQDYEGLGSALPDSLHVRDMLWIKAMGANFVRLAHYPQDPAILDAADSLGLLIWEEIPIVNYITPSAEFTTNSENMLREMIRQHANHPSVIMWGLMNEVFLWSPQGARIGKQNDTVYMEQVRRLAVHLDSVARAEDPGRVTTMAMHGSPDYNASRVSEVAMVLGQNVYSGWYSGVFEDFGKQLDRRHAQRPGEVIFISEYGAEDDARVNSLTPERFDFSGSWFKRFHESYLRQINAHPWLAGSAIWNQFDFSQPETGGSIPFMNQKGMQEWNRAPKDVYYLYKANWNPSPMVYIASRGWTHRLGTNAGAVAGAAPRPVPQPVDVYSNLATVELFANGQSLGAKIPDDVHHATWEVPFVSGRNQLVARGVSGVNTYRDTLSISFTYRPPQLSDQSIPFKALGVNVGGRAQFVEPDGFVWEGDQPYSPGGFGYVGGTPRMFDKDLAIRGSASTPLYFTYLSGLTSYRFDVPDGEYDLELLFAEPGAKPAMRLFSVAANGQSIIENLDLASRYGVGRAVSVHFPVTARGKTGVELAFKAERGDPILNGARIRRLGGG